MKTNNYEAKEQLIKRDRTRDKATIVFTKLYAKKRGKYKGWNSIEAKTLDVTDKLFKRNKM
ncbi:MAG: hypothetical protein JSW63_00045 [Ignavibacterium sp.]|nr:MAG: hypothetical protein JSW63_00045 [Ignavibacterium sp.]